MIIRPGLFGKSLHTKVLPKAVFCSMMRLSFWLFMFTAFLSACRSGEAVPDVSDLAAQTVVRRFDQDFFALDTNNLPQGLQRLQQQYPQFMTQYLGFVLGINPQDPASLDAIRAFLHSYRGIYDTARQVADQWLPQMEEDLQLGLRLMQHYFPGWKPEQPFEIIPFIGPMDAYEPFAIGDYGDVRTPTGVGVAMQLHLGGNALVYEAGRQGGALYDYQTRRFTPEMMAVNALKNVVEDAFPYRAAGLTLVEEMVEKGKRLYVLKKLMPDTPDSLQLGYTAAQLKGCEANEALIWNFFVKNDLLFSKEALINQNYIKDGPKTQELGEGAPGYIGLFVGRKIVESYMQKNQGATLETLMKMPAREVFDLSAYKP